MAKSCRVTITRPSVDVILPHEIFPSVRDASARYHIDLDLGITTYIQGHLTTTTIVDHVCPNDADYDAHKAEILSVVPWWQNDENRSEVDAYQNDNGIVVTIEDVVNPDVSSGLDVTRVFDM